MGREERCEIRFSFLGWTKEGKIIRSPIEIRDSCETRSRQSRYLFLRRVAADVSNGGRAIFTSRPVGRSLYYEPCVRIDAMGNERRRGFFNLEKQSIRIAIPFLVDGSV